MIELLSLEQADALHRIARGEGTHGDAALLIVLISGAKAKLIAVVECAQEIVDFFDGGTFPKEKLVNVINVINNLEDALDALKLERPLKDNARSLPRGDNEKHKPRLFPHLDTSASSDG